MSQWPMVKLGDVCTVVGGGTPKTAIPEYWGGTIPWLTPKDLSGNKNLYISRGERSITESGLDNSGATLLPKGTVLWSSRAPIGHVAIAETDVATNQGFKSFIPGPNVDSEYLAYTLIFMKDQLQRIGTGATFKEVSAKRAKSIQIPLPPLEEQRRIARLLNTSSTSIKLAKNELSATRNLVLQTTLSHVDETNRSIPLSDIVCIRGGMTPSKKDKSYWNGDINWFSSKDLKQDYLNRSADRITEKAVSSNSLRPTKTVGIAISIRGMSLAHTVPMSIIPAGSCVNQDLKILTPKNQISTDTLLQILKIKQPELLSRVSSSAHGTKKLDLRHLEALEIPDLTSDEYSWLQSFISKVRQVDFLLSTRLTLLEELHQSLATRAFTGQL